MNKKLTATLQTDGLTNDVQQQCNSVLYIASRGKNRRH